MYSENACIEKQSVQASATDATKSTSNASGECQNCGKAWNTIFFSSYISAFGNAGKSLVPLGVHLYIMHAPKITSLANICARVLGLHVLALWVPKTYSTPPLSILLDGSGLLAYVCRNRNGS